MDCRKVLQYALCALLFPHWCVYYAIGVHLINNLINLGGGRLVRSTTHIGLNLSLCSCHIPNSKLHQFFIQILVPEKPCTFAYKKN